MLSRENRLSKRDDIKKVLKTGRSSETTGLRIRFSENRLGKTRAAFLISTKVSKKATDRNRIKRRSSEIFRRLLTQIEQQWDILMIITAKADKDKKLKMTDKNIRKALEKAGLLARK